MRNTYLITAFFTCALMLVGCDRIDDDLELAPYPVVAEVFIDGFSAGLDYAAFGDSKTTAFDVDTDIKYRGESSIRISVPAFGDPAGSYAGGNYFVTPGRDLTSFNVLTFWAKASTSATIGEIGFGLDGAYQVSIDGLALNTDWEKYYIPIPDPSKLAAERSMLYYSAGPEDSMAYSFWLDDVRYEDLGTIAHPKFNIMGGEDVEETAENGDTFTIPTDGSFNLPTGIDQRIVISPTYYTFTSSDENVATVTPNGLVTAVGAGTATVTASLNGQPAVGSLTITSAGAPVLPAVPAPTPTQPGTDVTSIFSDAYQDVSLDFINGFWQFSTTQSRILEVAENDEAIRYTDLNFVGIQFTTPTIDISDATHFRMDVWVLDGVSPADQFQIELVDLGPDGTFGGDDNSTGVLARPGSTLNSGAWTTIDVPLASFGGLATRSNLAQIVLSGSLPNIFVDNVYFYREGGQGNPTEPTTAAPTPTRPAANVISLFSDAYNDVPVDTWRTEWSEGSALEDVTVAGNATKKYSNVNFVGVETVNNQIDATGMTHFHIDVWSGDFTAFGLELVDFGPDGQFDGGDDTKHRLDFTSPEQATWISYDIPLSDFVGLTNRANMAQYVLVAQPTGAPTIFIDNVYFYQQ